MSDPVYCKNQPRVPFDRPQILHWLRTRHDHPVTRDDISEEDLVSAIGGKKDIEYFVRSEVMKANKEEVILSKYEQIGITFGLEYYQVAGLENLAQISGRLIGLSRDEVEDSKFSQHVVDDIIEGQLDDEWLGCFEDVIEGTPREREEQQLAGTELIEDYFSPTFSR